MIARPRTHVTTRTEILTAITVWQGALGVTYLGIGVTESRRAGFEWVGWLQPVHIGILMIVGAGLCLTAVLLGRTRAAARFVDVVEATAFGVSLLPHLALTLVFAGATVAGTHPTGWVSAVSYVGFASMVFLAGGVIDPPGSGRETGGESD